mmetsp:Transcript_10376/g.30465  ORF Transcript_10376/g.30465 Transcript_10376/m.30465 type:complete len:112 (-) Transcript_10376:83-418(-)
MSGGFDFGDLDLSEAIQGGEELSSADRAARKRPPAGWSATKDGVRKEAARAADRAGPQGGDGGGPALPFRIRESFVKPAQTRNPLYTACFPYINDEKPDAPPRTKIMVFTH